MSLDADQAMDRRRLKRRLTVWRIAAVVAVVVAVVAAAGRFGQGKDLTEARPPRTRPVGVVFDEDAGRLGFWWNDRERRADP